jgi:hypothetical protein
LFAVLFNLPGTLAWAVSTAFGHALAIPLASGILAINICFINIVTAFFLSFMYYHSPDGATRATSRVAALHAVTTIFGVLTALCISIVVLYACAYSVHGIWRPSENIVSHNFLDGLFLSTLAWTTSADPDFVAATMGGKVYAAVQGMNGILIIGATLAAALPWLSVISRPRNHGEEVAAGRHAQSGPTLLRVWVWTCSGCDAAAKVSEWSCGCRQLTWIVSEPAKESCPRPPDEQRGDGCELA